MIHPAEKFGTLLASHLRDTSWNHGGCDDYSDSKLNGVLPVK